MEYLPGKGDLCTLGYDFLWREHYSAFHNPNSETYCYEHSIEQDSPPSKYYESVYLEHEHQHDYKQISLGHLSSFLSEIENGQLL